jgi:hypothetical protein
MGLTEVEDSVLSVPLVGIEDILYNLWAWV